MNTQQLKRIFEKAVKQGPSHTKNIQSIYMLIRSAVNDEFTEDSAVGLDWYLYDLFKKSQSGYWIDPTGESPPKEE